MIRKLLPLPILLLTAIYTVNAQVPVVSMVISPKSGCAPLAVSFNGSATGTGPFTWSWNFGGVPPNVNKSTSTFQNDAVLFNTPGKYVITLTATNASGTSVPKIDTVTVYSVPVADFTQDKTTGCYPTWVNFTNLSTPAPGAVITSYLWNFGDGTQDTVPSPSHRFTTGGPHNVILYVNDNFGCQGKAQVKNAQKAIVLTGGIFPNFNINVASSCNLPVTANFTNTTSGVAPRTYNWDFGDGGGFTDNTLNPTHNYVTAGGYTVRLAATSTQGCSDTLNLPLNISANGNLTDFTHPDTVCINTVVNFKNISSPNPNSSTWDYGDGSPLDVGVKDGLHTYTIPGKHTVLLTNTFFGCNGTITHDVYVVNPPVTNFTGINLVSCKPPLTSTFTNTTTGASSWSWDFGDGTTSPLQNPPPHTYSVLGDFPVVLTSSSAPGCSTTNTLTVHIDKPIVTLNGMPAYGCAPYTFSPSANVTAIDGVASYSWIFGNGNTSTAANPPPQTYAAGTFKIYCTITTTGGCSAIDSGIVKVGSVKPTAAFTFIPPVFCVDSLFKFTDGSIPSPGVDQWLWDFGDGSTAIVPNPTHSYVAPGTYNVRLTAYDQGCWDSLSHSVVVNPPLADFKFTGTCGQNNSFTFTDNSLGPITSWFWDFNDGTTSVAQNPPLHVFPVGPPKIYNVTLTVTSGGCANKKTYPVQANQSTVLTFSAPWVCVNTPITINAISPGNIFSYLFVFGDGSTYLGTGTSAAHTYTKPGTYQVKVITTENITGCVDSSSVYNVLIKGPVANFTPPPPLTCGALTYSYKDLSTVYPVGSSIVTWAWDFGDGTTSPAQNPPTHTYSFQGNFVPTLTVTDNSGCTSILDTLSAITVSIPIANFTISDTMSCPNAPNPLRFNNSSIAFNPTYTWDFGDGNTTSVVNPIYAYSIVNTFFPKLSIVDAYGCIANYTYPKPVIVDTPHASFTMSGNFSACPPFNDTFRFTGHYALTYAWDFTDGNGSTKQNPVNLFANPGDYWPYVIVTSAGGCTAQSDSQNVHIDGPIGNFTYSPLTGCDSLDVVFNVAGSNVTSFTWITGDTAQPVTTLIPTYTYRYHIPGQYTPIVNLKDAAGCIVPHIGTSLINVDAIVKAKFAVDRSIVCDSGVINFKDTSILGPNTSITSYTWDFGDLSAPQTGMFPTISHKYTTVGNYTATMSFTTLGGCSSGSIPMLITIAGSPNVAVTGLISQCEPAILNFAGVEVTPDPNQPLTWSWDFGNLQTSALQVPLPVSYPKAGQYKVQLIATNSKGCSDTTDKGIPFNLFIYPIPTVNAGADTTICDTSTLQLLASGSVSTTYNWLAPTPPASLTCLNCNNPVASSPFSTFFVLNGTSPQGCAAKDTINVTVNTPITVLASGTDSVCLGQSATLNATGASIYNWTPVQGLSNPNIGNPVATPDASQIGGAPSNVITYTVTGYDNKKCYSDTKSIDITAFNYPVIGLTPNATINVGNSYQINSTATTNIVSLNWTPSNTLSCANCLTPLATPTKTTKYVLTAINDGGCATMDSIRVQVICDGNNFFVPNSFSPNGDGVNDNFVVNGVGLNVIPSITIYNRWGQIVFQKSNFAPNVPSEGWDGTFNGQPAPPDVYIYTIQILCNNATLIPYHGNVTLIR